MAEGAVVFLIDKLSLFIQKEAKLFCGIHGEIVGIRNEFEQMVASVRVADSREDIDPRLKVWVKQAREAANDMADILEEAQLILAYHHGKGFFGFLHKIYHCLKSMKPRRRIASEIGDIKTRVIRISTARQNLRDEFMILETGSSSSLASRELYDFRQDALLLEEDELVGIDARKQRLISLLLGEGTELEVISVVGMGGLGKTTLVKKVYDDAEVKCHFQHHAWLTISESFKKEEVLKDMIQQLFKEIKQPAPQGIETMRSNELKQIVNQFLRQKKYIVALDDVWDTHALESIKRAFPKAHSGSRVILTTRSSQVAETAGADIGGQAYHLEPLSWDDSWDLFCRKVFRGSSCPQHLRDISQRILRKCEGLPLAVAAIGGVLATRSRRIDEWELLYHSLENEIEGVDRLMRIRRLLCLSYYALPYHLKICFLYLSIFPEDYKIERTSISRLWIAEEFMQGREGRIVEEVAESYLNDLVNRSLVQVAEMSTNGRLKSCRVHDLFRQIIVSMSREQNLVVTTNGESTAWPEKVRRLSIYNLVHNIEKSNCFHRLRSVFVFGEKGSLSMSLVSTILSASSRSLLRVLDLRDAPLETIPKEVFELYNLRYLSLRRTKVKMLPKSVEKHQNLEILDLKETFVNVLPNEIQQLRRLQYLLLYHCDLGNDRYSFDFVYGFKTQSSNIGGLSSLQKLSCIEANQWNGKIISEIGKLTQLRTLGITNLKKENGMALCSSIGNLSNLRRLFLHSVAEEEIIDLQYPLSSTPQFLRNVVLKGRLDKMPHWIPSLYNLTKLYLSWSGLKEDPLLFLQDLPILERLYLTRAYEGEGLCFKAGGFQRLKKLRLRSLRGLRGMKVEEGALPLLKELKIEDCKMMEEVPSGIEHLTNLQSLGLLDMHNKLVESLRNRDQMDGNYEKIAHIPEVWFLKFIDGRCEGGYL